jgi:phenylacetate-CoA ligase
MGVPLPSVTKALVSGEAFPPSLRDWFAERGIAMATSAMPRPTWA